MLIESATRLLALRGSSVVEQLLGRFRLLAEAARTDSATLYEARDEIAGEAASVTTLAPESIRTPGHIRAFQKRVQVVRGMDSPHTAKPLSAGLLDGQWFVACAGAPGLTVERFSAQAGALPPDEAFALGAQLFRALSHLHARNIAVHQLTPAAVLIDPDGVLKIWNVYMVTPPKTASKTLALGKMNFLAMTYAPAGETGGNSRAREARDVYGAGMVLAHLIAGGPPVQPASLSELLTFFQKPRLTFAEPLKPELEAIVLSALSPVAAKRAAARRVYSDILAATGLKTRQVMRISEDIARRVAG